MLTKEEVLQIERQSHSNSTDIWVYFLAPAVHGEDAGNTSPLANTSSKVSDVLVVEHSFNGGVRGGGCGQRRFSQLAFIYA